MSVWFDRFVKKWATSGLIHDPTDAEANAGFAFLGPTPPSVELFNALMQYDDQKDTWLYNQILNTLSFASIAVSETDTTRLRQAIVAIRNQLLTSSNTWTALQRFNAGIAITGNATATGTVQGGYINSTGNINAAATFTGNHATLTGNIQGGYINSTGNVNAAGALTGGSSSVAGDANANRLIAASLLYSYGTTFSQGNITTPAAVTSGYLHSTGSLQIDGSGIINGNLTALGLYGNYVQSNGSIYSAGPISANTGDITASNGKLRASSGSAGDANGATILAEYRHFTSGNQMLFQIPSLDGQFWIEFFYTSISNSPNAIVQTYINYPWAFPSDCRWVSIYFAGGGPPGQKSHAGISVEPINRFTCRAAVGPTTLQEPGPYGVGLIAMGW